ncbi:hypothetical protein BGZ91_003973 [Linnemannia elongata]|nr:hypothetical protein BGZ91_003973 [Linnemannia elongata]
MPTPATTSTSLSGSEATTKPEEEEDRVAAVSEDALFDVQSTSPVFSTQSDAASAAASAATQRYGRFRLQDTPSQWMPNLLIFLPRVLSNRQPQSTTTTIDELGFHDSTSARASSLVTRMYMYVMLFRPIT